MLRKGRTREQASAQFAGEWDEGGAGNAFSTANRRFAPLKMPFLPYSGGPTQSGGLKGRGQCEALHSPETPGTLSAWPVRRRMSPKMIKDERAAALSNSPWDFFDSLRGRLLRRRPLSAYSFSLYQSLTPKRGTEKPSSPSRGSHSPAGENTCASPEALSAKR